jgi:excisionase family DNA binding protein
MVITPGWPGSGSSNEMVGLLSTNQVARLAGVGPSAVKRWADAGHLPCLKTAGGHRRFEAAAVERFLRRGGPDPAVGRDDWAGALLAARQSLEVEALLLAERGRTGAWHRVAERAGAALVELGRRWQGGGLTVAEEHLASERLARALARLAESIPLPVPAPVALLTCAEGDDHTLGLSLVELVLREAGWVTRWLGRRTPVAEVCAVLARGEARLLAVSASLASRDAVGLRRQAEALGHQCRALGVLLVLGGAGAWPARPRYGMQLSALEPLHALALAERRRLAGPAGA